MPHISAADQKSYNGQQLTAKMRSRKLDYTDIEKAGLAQVFAKLLQVGHRQGTPGPQGAPWGPPWGTPRGTPPGSPWGTPQRGGTPFFGHNDINVVWGT